MPEIKGTVTEDLVKQALYSGEVNKLLKAQVRKDFEAQIDTYVDEVLAKLIGKRKANAVCNTCSLQTKLELLLN